MFLQSPSPRDLSVLICPILYFSGQSNYEILLTTNSISPSLNPKQSAVTVEPWSCRRQGLRWRLWWPGCFRNAHHLPGDVEAQTDGQGCAQAQAKTHAQERSEKILSSHILLILALQKQGARAQCTLSAWRLKHVPSCSKRKNSSFSESKRAWGNNSGLYKNKKNRLKKTAT